MKDKTKLVCLVVLAMNATGRLIFLGSHVSPFGFSLILTGAFMVVGIAMILAGIRKSELIAGLILGLTAALDVMSYEILPPLQNPFLWTSLLSLVAIGIAISIQEKTKPTTTSLIVPMLIMCMSIGGFRLTSGTIVDHCNLISNEGRFNCTVYIVRYADVMADKDFYAFTITLHTQELAYFDWVEKLEIHVEHGIFDSWQPTSGMTTGGSISIGPSWPRVSISIPLSDVRVEGGYTDKISWYLNPITENPADIEFGARLWTPIGTDLKWEIEVSAWSGYSIMWTWVHFWNDNLHWSTIPSQDIMWIRRHTEVEKGSSRFCLVA